MSTLYEHQKFKVDLIMQEKVYYVVCWRTLKGKCVLKLISREINMHFLQEICIFSKLNSLTSVSKSLLMISELGVISVVKMLWE